MAQTIEITEAITVGKLAELLSLPVSQLIAELFKNGMMVTVNENIDFDTAQILVSELGLDVELARKEQGSTPERPKRSKAENGEPRPPVVAMMGHVDHGKTSLLDAIRGASVAPGEAGGITQHLSAYQIKHNKRLLTFLDTPGHEAFAALREHGARLTDLVVVVIAADDGIKPQTLEAIRFARQAGVKIIVAANKMDKAGEPQLNQVKAQLAQEGLAPEGFGGDTIVVPVSAKEKTGINELLDIIFLVADVEELTAEKNGPAQGLIIESHMETGRGPVAEAMIEQGTLSQAEFIVAGNTYGKVRTLNNTDGQAIKSAGPSTPVVITGFKSLPNFGDEFEIVSSEKLAKDKASENAQANRETGSQAATSGSELLKAMNRASNLSEFNIIVKADVQGSLTSVIDTLKTLDTEEVAVKIASSGVGVISESDIHTAASTGAIIYGFHTSLPVHVKRLAARDKVSVRLYTIIYELIDDVKREMETRLSPEVLEEELGELIVKGVFKIAKNEVICGGQVAKGTLRTPALARVLRKKEMLAEDLEVTKLQRGPSEVAEIAEGEMCGLSFKSDKRVEVQLEDKIQLYRRETKARSL